MKIAELVRDKKIDGITDLRDETSLRTGVRVVIDVRKDANASVILNNLYKQTPLQTSFGVNMIALVNGRPKLINLKEALIHYLEHQKQWLDDVLNIILKSKRPCTYSRRFTNSTRSY